MSPITHMTIANQPPFTEKVEFQCDEQVNVLIGPNGTGKSTLIRYIRDQAHDCPCVTIPAVRKGLPLSNDVDGMRALIRESHRLDDLAAVLTDSPTTFDNSLSYQARHNMAERLSTQVESAQVVDNYFKALTLSYACSTEICSEILANKTPSDYIKRSRLVVKTEVGRTVGDHPIFATREAGETANLLTGMGFSVNHDIEFVGGGTYDRIFLGDLSDGTQGILSWIQYMAMSLVFAHEFQNGWEAKPAILLIDEIENHLHPTWQRRVIPSLLDHFPGLQIFATTHSPFVVAGRRAGQVHRLRRDEGGVLRMDDPNNSNIVGWTMDEVLRGLMGVEDPTDEQTANAARELRRLQHDGPLDSPPEEAKRQDRIIELQGMVDRDLLAGGVEAAELEQFERQFREALQRHRDAVNTEEDQSNALS